MLEFQVSRQHEPISNLETSRRSDTFYLESTERLPSSLKIIEGNVYVIASWDSNTYVRAGANNTFSIIDQYGDVLRVGKGYVLINPTY